jgi:leukotriene-A4 hydrolase
MASNQPFSEHKSQFDVDLATLSNYSEIRTTHTELEWAIDWDRQIISGHAKVQLQAVKDVKTIILDASELDVKSVVMNGDEVKWKLGEKIGVMGEGLHVDLGETLKVGKVSCTIEPCGLPLSVLAVLTMQTVELLIKYATTKECSAVGWLTPV